MALTSGSRIGPYEVSAPIGAGGMGQVWRATDTTLGRQVAIKILPDAFASDPDRLARFEREAKTLASLNHPHIAAIYGFEKSGGTHALVMELVDGEDLSQRIARGAIALDEALPIARQIANALEAAHAHNIIHRDLKPANIKMRADGTVKVLDFGLAKAMDRKGALSDSASMAPTITTPAMTQAGMILGTAAYMSPEQARGRAIDERADIWAFGAVLYEMLSGRRAFVGDDVTDTLAAVVLKEPDWNALPPATPPGIRRLLARSLRKDPKQRLHHVADARIELDDPVTEAAPAGIEPPEARRSWARLAAGAAVLLAVAAVAVVQTVRLSRVGAVPSSPVRFTIAPPAGVESLDASVPLAVLSPDGIRIVQSLRRGPVAQLFMRRLDEDEAKPIAGSENGTRPFFSPDGKWVAFIARGTMKKVAVDGGAAVDIGPADFGTGAWTPDDTIVFTPNYSSGLWRMAASGGTPQKLTEPNTKDGELGHFWPQILPDGKTVLFTSFKTPVEQSRIEAYSLETGARKVVMDGGFHGRYVASGHLLFARSTTVFAAPFDVNRQEVTSPPAPVLSDVAVDNPNGLAQFSVSSTGTLAYVSQSAANPPRRLAWLDRTGRISPIGQERRVFSDPRLSPDGRELAVSIRGERDADVWVYDLSRGTFGRVTTAPGTQSDPVWTPDGRRLYFLFEEPVFHIYSRLADGGPEPERILDGPFDVRPTSVSPDGGVLVYERNDPATTRQGIWLLPLTGERKPRAFVDTPAEERDGIVSPDGRWLAYRSDETGRDEVYLQSFPDGPDRVQVSTNGGQWVRWSRDGREIFFREGEKLMAASVRGREVGRPDMLFQRTWSGGYDVAPDGRFIAALPDENAPPTPARVVLNWLEELKQRVPTR